MSGFMHRAGSLLGSRTIWGGVILVINAILGRQIPEEVGGEAADAMIALFTAVGGVLVVIGRLGAREIIPPPASSS